MRRLLFTLLFLTPFAVSAQTPYLDSLRTAGRLLEHADIQAHGYTPIEDETPPDMYIPLQYLPRLNCDLEDFPCVDETQITEPVRLMLKFLTNKDGDILRVIVLMDTGPAELLECALRGYFDCGFRARRATESEPYAWITVPHRLDPAR